MNIYTITFSSGEARQLLSHGSLLDAISGDGIDLETNAPLSAEDSKLIRASITGHKGVAMTSWELTHNQPKP